MALSREAGNRVARSCVPGLGFRGSAGRAAVAVRQGRTVIVDKGCRVIVVLTFSPF